MYKTPKSLGDFKIKIDHFRRSVRLLIQKRICNLVYFDTAMDHKVKMKESKNIDKYLNLTKELKKLWNMELMVIPIIVVAEGTVPKDFEKRLARLEIRGRIETIQTAALVISSNTQKSPGDLKRPAVNQTPVKDLQLKLVWKTRKD